MDQIAQRSPEMFLIFEHTLAARRVLASKEQTLFHFAEEGIVNHEDTEFLVRKVLEPRLHLMESFFPTEDILFRLSECGNETSGLQKEAKAGRYGSKRASRQTMAAALASTVGWRSDDIIRRIRDSRKRDWDHLRHRRRATRVHTAVTLRAKQNRVFNLVRTTARLNGGFHSQRSDSQSYHGESSASLDEENLESYFAEMRQSVWKDPEPESCEVVVTALTPASPVSAKKSPPPPAGHPAGAALEKAAPNGGAGGRERRAKVGFSLPNSVDADTLE